MFEVISVSDWQAHHLMLFSISGVRFNLHFLLWMVGALFFFFWCGEKKERIIASVLIVFQFLIIGAAFVLDMIDFNHVGGGEFSKFIASITENQERSYGVRPDALMFAFIDYLTILVLTKLIIRPRRIIDPITMILLCLILLHLVVATFNFASSGTMMAYDVLWTLFYYCVLVVLFLTSGKMEKRIGHFSFLDYSHILFGTYRSKEISKKC